MGTPQSPSFNFKSLEEEMYNDANYAHEINDKMRVPKRIKATGEYSDEDHLLSNQNGLINSWNYQDKIDMNVPDRIVVLGHDQHLETRSTPREIQLENAILPNNSEAIRVKTPPRIITLHERPFPSFVGETMPPRVYHLSEDSSSTDDENDVQPPPYTSSNVMNGRANGTMDNSMRRRSQQQQKLNHDISMMSGREGTPNGDLTPHEEVMFLRRKLSSLNRRVLNIELNNEQRMQREKIIYCMGLAYFLLKTILWLNRN